MCFHTRRCTRALQGGGDILLITFFNISATMSKLIWYLGCNYSHTFQVLHVVSKCSSSGFICEISVVTITTHLFSRLSFLQSILILI